MKIDLHIHSTCSDGRFSVYEIFEEARRRSIKVLAITDHDTIACQPEAIELAKNYSFRYIPGIELTAYCSIPGYNEGQNAQIHMLAYDYDLENTKFNAYLQDFVTTRKNRAKEVFDKLNAMLTDEGKQAFTDADFEEIYINVPLIASRVHIADFLVLRGIVKNRREAFAKYLIECNVILESTTPEEISELVHQAGGKLFIAHPGDRNGCSLAEFTTDIREQHKIIEEHFMNIIDGLECYHSRHDSKTIREYRKFCEKHNLLISGGSDCHQHPKVQMGTIRMPDFIADQF